MPEIDPVVVAAEHKKENEATVAEYLQALQDGNSAAKISKLQKFKLESDPERYIVFEKLSGSIEADLEAQQADTVLVAAYLNTVAELLKTPANRTKIAQSKLIQKAFSLLDHSDPEVVVASLRILGNATAENEDNTKTVVDLGFMEKSIALVNQSNDSITRNAAGVLANLGRENEDAQKKLLSLGSMKVLINRLDTSKDPMTLKLVSFGILSLLDCEEGAKEFLELKGLEKIIELANYSDAKIRELALKALESLAEEDRMKRPLYEHQCVDFLLKIVNSDAPVELKHLAAKSLPHILTNDENMRDLFAAGHLEGFKSWLSHDDVTIRAYAALCISNLARSDENCVSMVKGGLAASIVNLLKRPDPKEKNSALAALRNLSLAKENKNTMGESGLVEELREIFGGDNLQLKFNAVVVAKILATGNEANGRKLLSSGVLTQLKTLMESTQHEGVQCESARVFVQVCLNKKDDILESVIQAKGLEAMKVLLESKHDILKTEALSTYALFLPLTAHHAELLKVMAQGLSDVVVGENADLKAKALDAVKALIHKDTYALFQEQNLFSEIEKLSKEDGPLQKTAQDILASKN